MLTVQGDVLKILHRALAIAVCGATALSVAVIAAPLASAPIGVILQAADRSVTDSPRSGATIYDGDVLDTRGDATLNAAIRGSRLYLTPNSQVWIRGLPEGFSATLERGTAITSSVDLRSFEILVDDVTIRPSTTRPSTIQMTRVSDHAFNLTAIRGNADLRFGEVSETLTEGTSWRVELRDESGPQDNPQPGSQHGNDGDRGPRHAGKNHGRIILIAIPAAAVVAGIVIGVLATRPTVSSVGP